MPGKGSAAKRHRQNEKRRLRNRIVRSKIKTNIKNFLDAVKKNAKDEAENNYRLFGKLIDRAVTKGVYHSNTAARKKSRMHRLLNKMS